MTAHDFLTEKRGYVHEDQTGGGCSAYVKYIRTNHDGIVREYSIWITDEGGCDAPTCPSQPIIIGLYFNEEERLTSQALGRWDSVMEYDGIFDRIENGFISDYIEEDVEKGDWR